MNTRPILKGWWDGYIQCTIAALTKRTCGETVCTPHFLGETLKHMSKCEGCGGKKDLLHDLSGFSDRLAAEVERVISTVSRIPIPTPYPQAVKLLIDPPGLAICVR